MYLRCFLLSIHSLYLYEGVGRGVSFGRFRLTQTKQFDADHVIFYTCHLVYDDFLMNKHYILLHKREKILYFMISLFCSIEVHFINWTVCN